MDGEGLVVPLNDGSDGLFLRTHGVEVQAVSLPDGTHCLCLSFALDKGNMGVLVPFAGLPTLMGGINHAVRMTALDETAGSA